MSVGDLAVTSSAATVYSRHDGFTGESAPAGAGAPRSRAGKPSLNPTTDRSTERRCRSSEARPTTRRSPDQPSRPHRRGDRRALPDRSVSCRPPTAATVAGLVAQAGDVHPLEGIDGLAQDDHLAGVAIVGSRRDADRHAHVVVDAVARVQVDAGVPIGSCVGVAVRTARCRVADLAVQRSAVRRRAVAEHGGGLRHSLKGVG